MENLESVVLAIGEDLHVQRLRQIWRNIELKLSLDLPQVLRDRALLKSGGSPLQPVPVDDVPAGDIEPFKEAPTPPPSAARLPVPAE